MPLLSAFIDNSTFATPLTKKNSIFGSSDGEVRSRMTIGNLSGERYRVAVERVKPWLSFNYIAAQVAEYDSQGVLQETTVWVNKNSLKKRFSTEAGLSVLARFYPEAAREAAQKLSLPDPTRPPSLAGRVTVLPPEERTEKLDAALKNVPRKERQGPLVEAERARLREVMTDGTPVAQPAALRVQDVARTVLKAPGKNGESYAVFDEEGDKSLGAGTFKSTHYAVGSDGELYAVAVCNVDQRLRELQRKEGLSDQERIKKQAQVITLLKREGEITTHIPSETQGVLQTKLVVEHEGKFYFVMKLCPGGDLMDLLLKLHKREMIMTDCEKLRLGIDALRGLENTHALEIVHRDIKPDNILLDENGIPKVCDFGFATYKSDHSPNGMQLRQTGTPYYMAPEVAKGKTITENSDVWSMGVTLYTLYTGDTLPWREHQTPLRILWELGSLKPDWKPEFPEKLLSRNPDMDEPLKDLISDMLNVNPNLRPTAAEARQRLETILSHSKDPVF